MRVLSLGGVIGLIIVLGLIVVALVGSALYGVDPGRQQLTARLQPPVLWGGSSAHPFGTDALGRDLLARVLAGARISLIVGVVATAVAGAIGITLGLIAGYAGRLLDRLISFVVDVQMAVPFVVIAIGVVAVLGNTLVNVIAVLALTGWVGYARIVRLEVMALRRAPFAEAARAIGASPARILVRHLLPNVAGSIIVIGSQQVAAMILYEAALSYLGLGVPSNYITWGRMVADGQTTLMNAWWVSTVPGIAIALTILGLNVLGDWLRDVLDPATHRRRV
ncbi:MAG TPA: ABC transporter permease [Thermomicrobiales bacterium]|jgi:peptide/nickel transport system permease protein|nr:ABC transporter permease [Thermomicrobiales bacterium]